MKISIVTVTLNSCQTVGDTLESVLQQRYDDFELIVIDGGSNDGTIEIVRAFEPRFGRRLRWVSEPDRGLYDGMNKGIRMATGDVVGIINSDDFYHRYDILGIIAEAFGNHPEVQAIYGDIRYVHPNHLDKTVRYFSSKRFRPWKFRWGKMPPHPSFFTYRENFERYGFYHDDYEICADFELMIRFLYTHKLTAFYVPEVFMTMRTGGKTYGGIRTGMLINREKARACKENGIYTNTLMLMTRYVGKLFELR